MKHSMNALFPRQKRTKNLYIQMTLLLITLFEAPQMNVCTVEFQFWSKMFDFQFTNCIIYEPQFKKGESNNNTTIILQILKTNLLTLLLQVVSNY